MTITSGTARVPPTAGIAAPESLSKEVGEQDESQRDEQRKRVVEQERYVLLELADDDVPGASVD